MSSRRGNEYILKDAIGALMRANGSEERWSEAKAVAAWERLMGKTVARYTKRIVLKQETLYLTIDSAPLRNELMYARNKIIELLNREAGMEVIKEVVIR